MDYSDAPLLKVDNCFGNDVFRVSFLTVRRFVAMVM